MILLSQKLLVRSSLPMSGAIGGMATFGGSKVSMLTGNIVSRVSFVSLYDYVHRQAQTNTEKVCGFRLYVERGNQQAHQAYAHIGFQETPYQMHEIDFSEKPLSPSTSAS